MARTGGNSQDRRRARRAASRYSKRNEQRVPVSATEMQDFETLVATAHADAPPELDAADDFAALAAEARGPEAEPASPEVLALERLDAFVDRPALIAAAGDVSWGPEDGFLDLIADVNELLYDAPGYCRVIDAGVKLDKVLVYDGDDAYWSAPISIDGNGEPVLADRDQWTPVEQGWIEVPPGEDADDEPDFGEAEGAGGMEMSRDAGTFAGRLRFALRDVMLADGALEVDLPDEMQPTERLPERRADVAAPEAAPTQGGPIAWRSKFVPEATLTDDGRAFAPDSLSWRELPLSLMAMIETSAQGGHDGAMLSGRIDRIWREGNDIMAEGVFDDGEFGLDIARMVGDGTLRGLSVDIAIHEYEVGPQSDYFNEDGSWREDAPVGQEDDRTPADLLFGEKSDERQIFVVTKGVIGMATVCPFPAFAEASIALIASGAGLRYTHQAGFIAVRRPSLVAAAVAAEPTDEVEVEVELEDEPAEDGLTAAAAGHAPVKPPAEWFENPDLEELTPLTITEDGRVYGHAWAWESCHLAFADACVTAPHSETENAYFHLGEIECEGGERLTVGKVTIDAPHAGQRLSRADATAHYDHTGSVAAHVRCGEDEYGGWFAGAIQPDLPEETLRLLRGSVLSGDWRTVNGNLELVALLAVNVPGFPVPRVRALVASGDEGQEVLSLTAAGVVLERTDEEEIADIAALADEARA